MLSLITASASRLRETPPLPFYSALAHCCILVAAAEAEIRESTEMAFEAYREQLESVPRFTSLGRVMMAGDDDWPAVAGNLHKARRSWGRLQRILGREGATPRISGSFFKAVVQQVLLFGAET